MSNRNPDRIATQRDHFIREYAAFRHAAREALAIGHDAHNYRALGVQFSATRSGTYIGRLPFSEDSSLHYCAAICVAMMTRTWGPMAPRMRRTNVQLARSLPAMPLPA